VLIPFFKQEISNDMKEAAIESLENENFVMGESVHKFEEEFAKYIGTRYAVSISSGTNALFLSLLSLDIKKGDNVVTSTNSFVASANSIKMANANPILADINEDGNINVEKIDKKIQAILPVHIYGNPCDFDSIFKLSEEQKIPIIEDACQAHGAEFKNKKAGNLGTIGCFSFYPTKNMTVGGDGGMITTNDEEIADIIRSLRDNGRNLQKREVHDKFGYTMRLNSISAAIGRVQLKKLNKFNDRRREIMNLYQRNLEEDILVKENKFGKSVFHQIVIKHKNRDIIKKKLEDEQIGTAIHYTIPIHKQPIYQNGKSLPNSEEFCKIILSLPSYPSLSDGEVKTIAEKINSIINEK